MLLEHAIARQHHRDVERRLAAHRRKQCIRLLALDDQLHELGGHGLEIRPVRDLRVRHDRGRVRVDENHLVPFLAQRLGRLGAGVVELGRLPDDDGAGANDENTVQISASRHESDRR